MKFFAQRSAISSLIVGLEMWSRSSRAVTAWAVKRSTGVVSTFGSWAAISAAVKAAMPARAMNPFGRRKAIWGMSFDPERVGRSESGLTSAAPGLTESL